MSELIPDPALAALLDDYAGTLLRSGQVRALRNLRRGLESAPSQSWRDCARALSQRGDSTAALLLLEHALGREPQSLPLRYQLGETLLAAGDDIRAEIVLRPVAAEGDEQAAESLAKALRSQGKLSAAAETMAALVEHRSDDLDITLGRLRFINGCQRQPLAATLCDRELERGTRDPHLYEFSGKMSLVLGRFAEARERFLAALHSGIDLNLHFILFALAGTQRYSSAGHPDFALFESHLQNPDLSPLSRASIFFALGKAHDDVGNPAAAAAALRQANALVRSTLSWSRDDWRLYVANQRTTPPPPRVSGEANFVPVFVVGLPRSGTTLVADRIGRHPQVRNRGELNLVPYLDKWVAGSGRPQDPQLLQSVARFAAAQICQDDAPAQWYVDKNPLNFRFLGLLSAVLPAARIVYCKRNLRDTALSIWSQSFARGEDNGYAYTFPDIAAFAAGCDDLMAHWQRTLPLPIHVVEYEKLIEQPEQGFRELADFLDLPEFDVLAAEATADDVITTSSAWQARQPIYQRSSGRWAAYAPYLPELTSLF